MQVFQNSRFLFLCIAILMAANIFVYRTTVAPRVLKVSVLEVGKGNAILIQSPSEKTFLIDVGPDASILRALGEALPMWQRNIDAVILTGTKNSFVGGLPEVENRYRVGALMHFGDAVVPYGTSLTFDGFRIEIISPGTLTVSYGATSFTISSSTLAGTYISDGELIQKPGTK